MKLFSSERFTKPGKGVDVNAKPKPAFIRFFIVLWNKRNKLLGINFLYFLSAIPAVIIAVAAFAGTFALYDMFDTTVSISEMISVNETASGLYFKTLLFFAIFFTSIPVFSSGPFYAGFTYIIKSFYKEEPIFLWHDYITKTRSNLKLGLKTMFFNLVCGILIMLSIMSYMVIANPNNPTYNTIPWVMLFIIALVEVFFAVILVMMNLYMYPMITTFNLSFKQLIKNTFVLCMIKWLPSLGIILLDVLLIALPVYILPMHNYIVFGVNVILYAAVYPSFIALINMFFVYPVFKKYLIDNPDADKSDKTGKTDETEYIPEKRSSGRFENGMWISEDEPIAEESGKETGLQDYGGDTDSSEED